MKVICLLIFLCSICISYAMEIHGEFLSYCFGSDIPRDYYTIKITEPEFENDDMFACIRISNNSPVYRAAVRCHDFEFMGAKDTEWIIAERDCIFVESGESLCFFIKCPENWNKLTRKILKGRISLFGNNGERIEMEITLHADTFTLMSVPDTAQDALKTTLTKRIENDICYYTIRHECNMNKSAYVLCAKESFFVADPVVVICDKRGIKEPEYAYCSFSLPDAENIVKVRLLPGDIVLSEECQFYKKIDHEGEESQFECFSFTEEELHEHMTLISEDLSLFPRSSQKDSCMEKEEAHSLNEQIMGDISGAYVYNDDIDLEGEMEAAMDQLRSACELIHPDKPRKDYFAEGVVTIRDASTTQNKTLTRAEKDALNQYIYTHAKEFDRVQKLWLPRNVKHLTSKDAAYCVTHEAVYLFIHNGASWERYKIERSENDSVLLKVMK